MKEKGGRFRERKTENNDTAQLFDGLLFSVVRAFVGTLGIFSRCIEKNSVQTP